MTVDDVRAFHERAHPAVGGHADCGRRLRSCHHPPAGARCVRRVAGSGGATASRATRAPSAAAAQHCSAAVRAAVGAADRPRGRRAQHARLSRAGDGEHGARRAIQQPHQPEPARGQGLHLRRAHGVRIPAPPRSIRAAGRRADERHGAIDRGIDRRDLGDGQHAAHHRRRSCGWRPRRSRAATRGTSRRPIRSRAPPPSWRCTTCPTPISPSSFRGSSG